MKTFKFLITVFVITSSFCFGQAAFKPPREPVYEHFMLGVFIASQASVQTVPMSKMFSDFATHGIEIAWVNMYNYYPLAEEKKLNQYAKANGVSLIVQMDKLWPYTEGGDKKTDDELKAIIKRQVDRINKLPDSDVVDGWALGDEIENLFHRGENREQRRRNSESRFQQVSRLVREIDPNRRVTINHDGWDWMASHEDEPWCTTQHTDRYNRHNIRKKIALAQKLGYKNYFVAILATQPVRTPAAIGAYGYRGRVNIPVIDNLTLGERIQDYAETAYLEGAKGCVYYLYGAGGAPTDGLALVDIHGNDYQGKWDAVLKAARNIRKWEGFPSCKIVSPLNYSFTRGETKITVDAQGITDLVYPTDPRIEADPVTVVKADYSTDDCLTWTPLPDATDAPYKFILDPNTISAIGDRPTSCFIRTRAFNKRGSSLWDVIEIRLEKGSQ